MYVWSRYKVLLFFLILATCEAFNRYSFLWKKLMTNYSKNALPDWGKLPVTAQIAFNLARIESLVWFDPELRWDANVYGVKKLVVAASDIWLPEITMLNSANQGNDLSLDSKFRASVDHSGVVIWSPGFKWETSCEVDLLNFPFDHQICYLNFTNWMHTAYNLNYSLINGNAIILMNYQPNAEWLLAFAEQGLHMITYPGPPPMEMPMAYIKVILVRNPTYFSLNVVLPSILMMILTAAVFALPPDSGEKVSMAISLFLSFVVVLLIVFDITPRNGKNTPTISILIIVDLCISGLSLVVSVAVVALSQHSPERPVPGCIRTVCGALARAVCMGGQARRAFQTERRVKQQAVANSGYLPDNMKHRGTSERLSVDTDILDLKAAVRDLQAAVLVLTETLCEKDKADYSAQWKMVANIIDRWFLILYSLASIAFIAYMSYVSVIASREYARLK